MEGRVIHKRPWEKILEDATPPAGIDHNETILDRLDPVRSAPTQPDKQKMLESQIPDTPRRRAPMPQPKPPLRRFEELPKGRILSPEEVERIREQHRIEIERANRTLDPQSFEGI